jgi:hypothetical protein
MLVTFAVWRIATAPFSRSRGTLEAATARHGVVEGGAETRRLRLRHEVSEF